ncbi:CopD family protein [Streptomyces sp. NPDC050610]|uniref:CopD family protein n=1 Tax=Streptomyces sp. NPDC050610 TaxID=3157097 RepID=UPI0034372EEC
MMLPGSSVTDTRRRRARLIAAVAAPAAAFLVVSLLGATAALSGTNELTVPGAGVTTMLRAVLLAAFSLQLGEAAANRLTRTIPDAPELAPRSWGLTAPVAGFAAAAGQIVVLAGDGSLAAGLTSGDLVGTYATRPGGLALLEANGFLFAGACIALRRPGLAPAPLSLVAVGEALRAHPEANTPLLGSLLTLIHLSAAALWAGGLVHVLRTMRLWRGRPDAARALLRRYARPAAALFAALAVTGTFSTLRRLPLDAVLTTAYGRALLAKLALVAVVGALALAARFRLHRSSDPDSPAGPVRPARAEAVALGAVILVSAVITALPVPAASG